jgi:DNA-binding LacI/PurR family transcriptional regulator
MCAKLPGMPRRRAVVGDPAYQPETPFSLKQLADHLGLAPATVSLVLNGSAVANTIAPETKKQIFAAAKKFNYRPNFFARCLRTRRSFTIGVMVSEISEGYNATVLSGIEDHLLQEGYFYFVASHRFRPDLIDEYPQLFLHRSVDGLIVVNAPWHLELTVPVVTVSSHHQVKGVTSILLDHHRAAELALHHLWMLGHRDIAFIKGQPFVPDTQVRWNAIVEVARQMGLPIRPNLVGQIEENSPSPELGYRATQKLLAAGKRFTALFAFNDISAMGAIRALHESGRSVPGDLSVVGFDDIESAAYQNPGLTTVQQPLRKMGRTAAETVLRRIAAAANRSLATPTQIIIEPELIVRGTTAAIAAQTRVRAKILRSGQRQTCANEVPVD